MTTIGMSTQCPRPRICFDELDAVEFRKLEIGEDHVDAVLPRVLQRPARRVEQLQVQLRIDLTDDFGDQQTAAEQVVDDEDGIALGSREGELEITPVAGAERDGKADIGYLPGIAARESSTRGTASKAIVMPLVLAD